jgi:hypothetical protein
MIAFTVEVAQRFRLTFSDPEASEEAARVIAEQNITRIIPMGGNGRTLGEWKAMPLDFLVSVVPMVLEAPEVVSAPRRKEEGARPEQARQAPKREKRGQGELEIF